MNQTTPHAMIRRALDAEQALETARTENTALLKALVTANETAELYANAMDRVNARLEGDIAHVKVGVCIAEATVARQLTLWMAERGIAALPLATAPLGKVLDALAWSVGEIQNHNAKAMALTAAVAQSDDMEEVRHLAAALVADYVRPFSS